MATQAEIDQAKQEVADAKYRAKAGKAYNAASSVEPSPDARDAVRGQKGYAKGGTASSRADGIAARGKTRGKIR